MKWGALRHPPPPPQQKKKKKSKLIIKAKFRQTLEEKFKQIFSHKFFLKWANLANRMDYPAPFRSRPNPAIAVPNPRWQQNNLISPGFQRCFLFRSQATQAIPLARNNEICVQNRF